MYNSDGSLGVPEDQAKAAQLYMKAAQAGDAQAMNNLGLMYGRVQGVPQDIAKALYWWRKAVKVDKDGSSGKAAQSWLDYMTVSRFSPGCPDNNGPSQTLND